MTWSLRAVAVLVLLAVTLFEITSSRADEPKRAVPDFDGRGSGPTTPGDVALWVPRVTLFPLYLTSEYLIRRPLGALVVAAERSDVPRCLYDFFAFGPGHKSGLRADRPGRLRVQPERRRVRLLGRRLHEG